MYPAVKVGSTGIVFIPVAAVAPPVPVVVGAFVVKAPRNFSVGIKKCAFDRNGYLYHGRVKSLADGVRKGGLNF